MILFTTTYTRNYEVFADLRSKIRARTSPRTPGQTLYFYHVIDIANMLYFGGEISHRRARHNLLFIDQLWGHVNTPWGELNNEWAADDYEWATDDPVS
jgi:hypothetical protein